MIVTKYAFVGDETVNLPIVGASPSDKFILKNIDGLGPPDFLINIGKSIYQNGIYQGSRPQPRQIVARVGLNPDYTIGETVESLRETLYSMISAASGVTTFEAWNGLTRVAITIGWVSKCEIVPFAKDPEVQITLDCQDAYMRAPLPIDVDLTGMSTSTLEVDDIGSIHTGFRLDITLTANLSSFRISQDLATYLHVDYAFLSGDHVVFNTIEGQRDIIRTRSGTPISLIDNISSNSEWIPLFRGVNELTMSSSSFTYNELTYQPLYLGV